MSDGDDLEVVGGGTRDRDAVDGSELDRENFFPERFLILGDEFAKYLRQSINESGLGIRPFPPCYSTMNETWSLHRAIF